MKMYEFLYSLLKNNFNYVYTVSCLIIFIMFKFNYIK